MNQRVKYELGASIPIALWIFLAGQLGLGIWWASELTTNQGALLLDVSELRSDVKASRDEITDLKIRFAGRYGEQPKIPY